MMTYEQYLLTKLAEECMEVAKRALKLQQFGADEVQAGQEKTNKQRLFDELNDLRASIEMLHDVEICYDPELQAVIGKMKKVDTYLAYSRSLGKVQPL